MLEGTTVRRKAQIAPYRLHRGLGQALVHIDGRDVYLDVHNTPESKAKYHEIIRKVLADRTGQRWNAVPCCTSMSRLPNW